MQGPSGSSLSCSPCDNREDTSQLFSWFTRFGSQVKFTRTTARNSQASYSNLK
ncbi:Hypothetical protein FKW44_010264 [Caligus rogercresseyi]|uniref:Uncharacterized protein n=1 Tax=Caligus rogercresseyi TaxID=217165 RepID=A0A7T8K9F2_CALRO|nr:Hypothetical protein FKW44_010264 [Caligus rogercresseyi]